jgi:hypothetical protein
MTMSIWSFDGRCGHVYNMDPDEINDQPAKNVDKWRDITQPKLCICNDFARKLSCIRLMTRSSRRFSHGLYLLNPMFPLQGSPPQNDSIDS